MLRLNCGALLDSIAIDSTELKRFGRGKWHQGKYKLSGKRSWRKLHIAVDDKHIIHASDLTDRFVADCKSIETLAEQIDSSVDHITLMVPMIKIQFMVCFQIILKIQKQ